MKCVRCNGLFIRAEELNAHPCYVLPSPRLSYSMRSHPSGIKVGCHECGQTETAGDRDGAVWWLALHDCSAGGASRPAAAGTAGAEVLPSAPAIFDDTNTYQMTRRPSWRKNKAAGHLTKGGL